MGEPVSPLNASVLNASNSEPPSPRLNTNSEPTSPVLNTTNLNLNVSTILGHIDPSLNASTIIEPGITIVQDSSSVLLTTYDPANPQITENLSQSVTIVKDSSEDESIVNQIKLCAAEIKCSDFHGKGSVDDYAALFDAASKIVSDVKQVQLDVDIQGFNEFGQAADELSLLFEGFTKKIQSVNIIDDSAFLQAILGALRKIVHLSNTFGDFKKSIIATNTIQLSESVGQTKKALKEVTDEVNCAMKYIQHFVEPSGSLPDSELNEVDKNVIRRATTTIEAWSQIYEKGVSIAMNQNEDIQYIHYSNESFRTKAVILKTTTDKLRNKYLQYF
jgi:hypothetical protein